MKVINFIIFSIAFILSACSSKNDSGGGLNPFTPQNTQTSSVKIDVSHLESTEYDNVVEFYFKPSVSLSLSQIEVSVLKFTDVLEADSQTIYQKSSWHLLVGYQGVNVGQKWSFTFHGKDLARNKEFKMTLEYKVNN